MVLIINIILSSINVLIFTFILIHEFKNEDILNSIISLCHKLKDIHRLRIVKYVDEAGEVYLKLIKK